MRKTIFIDDVHFLLKFQNFALSPDGKQICFVSYQDNTSLLYLMSSSGAFPSLCHKINGLISPPKWSPGGDWIAWSYDGIKLWSTQHETLLSTTEQNTHLLIDWAPNGDSLLFIDKRDKKESLWVANPNGSLLIRIHDVKGKIHHACWSPDSNTVLVISEPYLSNKILVESINVLEGEDPILIWEESHSLYSSPAAIWFPDNNRLLVDSSETGYSKLWILDLGNLNKTLLNNKDQEERNPVLNKDASFVAYSCYEAKTGNWPIVTQKIGNPKLQVLVEKLGVNRALAWSPDNTKLFFTHESPQEPEDLWTRGCKNRRNCATYIFWIFRAWQKDQSSQIWLFEVG